MRQLGNIMALQAKQSDGWDLERNATVPSVKSHVQAELFDGWNLERNATEPSVKQTAAPRDLQREGDILRWRILHYQHSFAHIQAEAALPLAVTGTAIAEANAEEMQRS